MSLPKLEHPTFELTIPSSKNPVRYRPFLVKEEKILLMAQESGEEKEVIHAIQQIIANCLVEGDFSVETAPTFDVEYFFLKLRALSVNDVAKITITDEDNQSQHEVEINLNEIDVIFPDSDTVNNIVEVTDNLSLELRYPTFSDLEMVDAGEILTGSVELMQRCVARIYNGEEVFDTADYTAAELNEFVENLPADTFEKMQDFFTVMPKLSHEVSYKVGKKTKKQTIEGLASFL
jgi:hypothetical protein